MTEHSRNIPENFSILNERTFKPNSPDVLIDNAGRQYRPKAYNDDERTHSYHCRINPHLQTEPPLIGDTIVLKTRQQGPRRTNRDTVGVGIVEECFFRRPRTKQPSSKALPYISSTVGIIVLRKHPKYGLALKNWH